MDSGLDADASPRNDGFRENAQRRRVGKAKRAHHFNRDVERWWARCFAPLPTLRIQHRH